MAHKQKLLFQDKLNESLEKHRDNIALVCGDQQVSYLELEKKSSYICGIIIDNGIERDTLIGIYIDGKIDFIAVMIGILKAGCVFVPLDTSLPGKRLRQMAGITDLQAVFSDRGGRKKWWDNKNNSRASIKTFIIDDSFSPGKSLPVSASRDTGYSPEDKLYVYFTSGTTGTPKAIVGKNKSLLHFIDWEIVRFGVNKTYRMSQFASPGFDAFLKDVFVPLLAGGTVCIPSGREILLDGSELTKWIDTSQLDLVHCVPSVFRLFNKKTLIPGNFKALKYVLLAGETLHPAELKNWYDIFGERIQLVNLYGATETTVLKTCYFIGKGDVEKKVIPIGRAMKGAREVILDKNLKICDPGIVGEIYIRTPYRTFGYLNDPELTRERFIPNPFNKKPNDLIYKTGDLGRPADGGNLEFLGRIDRQVKIRGVRVELEEIENLLLRHQGIRGVVVRAVEDDKHQNNIAAYYVLDSIPGEEPAISNLRDFLSERLPDYMVPAYFIKLAEIPLTSNGKIDWKVLPDPKSGLAVEKYAPPTDDTGEILLEIWSGVLGVEKERIGIDNNFFELGGHSLNAIAIVSQIHKEMKVEIPLLEIFRNPDIRSLSGYIKEAGKDKYASLEPVEEKQYYELSSAQKRLYFLQRQEESSTGYNMPQTVILEGKIEKNKLEDIFRQLIRRHETLRTSFAMMEGEPVQEIFPFTEVEFEIEYYDLAARQLPTDFVRPFDLSRAPLLLVVLAKEGEKHILMVDIHHIISDGVSCSILMQDFMALYNGEELPPLKLQYKDYSEWHNTEKQKEMVKKQEEYWLSEFGIGGGVPVLNLPKDYPRPQVNRFRGDRLRFEIAKEETALLKRMAVEENTTLFVVLLTVFYVFLSILSEQEDIIVGTGIAGRNHADLEQVMGMFVNLLALRNRPEGHKRFGDFLIEVKGRTLAAFENREYQYEDLVNNLGVERRSHSTPLFDVVFSLQTMDPAAGRLFAEGIPGLRVKRYELENKTSKFDLTLNGREVDGKLNMVCEYSTGLFKKQRIERYIKYFKEIVTIVLDNRDIQLRHIKVSYDLFDRKINNPLADFGF
jgi:amino acid adenylation domain-containing protein